MNLDPGIRFGADGTARFLILLAVALVYIGLFLSLGMFVSALTRRSASTLVVLLLLWTVVVFILPNLGTLVARQIVDVPSVKALSEKRQQIWTREVLLMIVERREAGQAAAGTRTTGDSTRKHFDTINKEQDQLELDYRLKFDRLVRLSKTINRLSPAAGFVYAETELAGTGIGEENRLKDEIMRYKDSVQAEMARGDESLRGLFVQVPDHRRRARPGGAHRPGRARRLDDRPFRPGVRRLCPVRREVAETAMLRTLIRKEFLNSVFSFRFVVIFALLLVVVPVTLFVLTGDYVKKVDEFSFRRATLEDYLKNFAHFNRLSGVVQPAMPPLPAQAMVRGITSGANLEDFDDDPLPVMFPLIDLVFIVAILLGLAALILSYDAVSGEKEDGTLKLMLANGVPRHRILLGKVIGGTATLLVPFLVSLLVGLVGIVVNPRVAWTGADWGALGLLVLGAAAYVAFFHILGVFISSRHASSSASIVTALSVWVILVLVVPNLSPFVAQRLAPAPSRIKTSREISRLTDVERDALGTGSSRNGWLPCTRVSRSGQSPPDRGRDEGAGGKGPGFPRSDRRPEEGSVGGLGRSEQDPEREGQSPP